MGSSVHTLAGPPDDKSSASDCLRMASMSGFGGAGAWTTSGMAAGGGAYDTALGGAAGSGTGSGRVLVGREGEEVGALCLKAAKGSATNEGPAGAFNETQ